MLTKAFWQMFAILAKVVAPAPVNPEASIYNGLDGSVCPQYSASVQSLECNVVAAQ